MAVAEHMTQPRMHNQRRHGNAAAPCVFEGVAQELQLQDDPPLNQVHLAITVDYHLLL